MRTFLVFCLFACAGFVQAAVSSGTAPVSAIFNAPERNNPPEINCPANALVIAVPSECSAVYAYTVTASDDTPGWTLTQTEGLPSGAIFPTGHTLNRFQVQDVDGNTAACSFSVTVVDTLRPEARCKQQVAVTLGPDDPDDCFDGAVLWVPVSAFDDGSSDNCGNFRLTIRRVSPFSDCVNSLNPINGHADCYDLFPDFPSEFERSISEQDSVKFYCCDISPDLTNLELRAYQLNADGTISYGPDDQPIYSACTPTVQVLPTECPPLPFILNGHIELDKDKDCVADDFQFDIPMMALQAVGPDGQTRYSASDATGYFSFGAVDSGEYLVTVNPASPAWQICNNPMTLQSIQGFNIGGYEWSAKIETDCPVLTTDLLTTPMRPCSTSVLHVSNCNIGGTAASDAYVQVSVDPQLTVVDASLPYTLNGNLVNVPLGNLAAGACVDFTVTVQVPCTPAINGVTLCNEAHIFPDTICVPPSSIWSGAQIEAQAECEGDSVRFILRNTGTAPTATALDYIVIDDMVIMRQGMISAGFGPGAEQEEVVYAQGDALRLLAEQEVNHPMPVAPSVALENCNGSTFPSQILNFRNESGNPFTDRVCRQVGASYDPNEKLAFPVGNTAAHLIEPNTWLTYQLGFQNTGTDTAFTVVLRDTLSELLDPASIRMGASTHPYTWTLGDQGVLSIHFDQILLPDSFTNERASHGYVQFDIDQKPDNPIGARIENRAGIYFDINPVVLTNTVFHTVGKVLTPSATHEPGAQNLLQLYPNPAITSTYLPLDAEKPVRVLLRDPVGRLLRQYSAEAPGLLLPRDGLPAGVYFVEAQWASGQVQRGKLVWQ